MGNIPHRYPGVKLDSTFEGGGRAVEPRRKTNEGEILNKHKGKNENEKWGRVA